MFGRFFARIGGWIGTQSSGLVHTPRAGDVTAPARGTVAISYAHGEAGDAVVELARRLRGDGVNVEYLDVYEPSPAIGWSRWMTEAMKAGFVLVVCDCVYYESSVLARPPGETKKGVAFEAGMLLRRIIESAGRNEHVIPIVFDAADLAWRIEPLADVTCYTLPQDYEKLYARLTGRLVVEKPPLGPVREVERVGPRPLETVSSRFAEVVDALVETSQKARSVCPLVHADVSRVLGHADPSRLARQFAGHEPVTFDELAAFASAYGVNARWLESGEGAPFAQSARFGDDAGKVLRLVYQDGAREYERLYFVLEDAPRGTASVWGERAEYRLELLLDDIPVHTDTGGGGRRRLRELCLLLATVEYLDGPGYTLMQLLHTRGGICDTIPTSGFVLSPSANAELLAGSVHPAGLLAGLRQRSTWHEDLADVQYPSAPYTPNYTAAHAQYKEDMLHDGVATNAQLHDYIRREIFKHWESPLDVARALGGVPDANTSEDVLELVKSALADPAGDAADHVRRRLREQGRAVPYRLRDAGPAS